MERVRGRLLIMLGFLAAISCSTPQEAMSLEKKTLSTDVDLADWGISRLNAIGYLSLGVLQDPKGAKRDRLVVYDVRRNRPSMPPSGQPISRSPELKDGVFVVSHFDRGNRNNLGGYFNTFSRLPSRAAISIDQAPDGTPALSFSYSQVAPGFAGFWVHLFDFKVRPEKRIFFDTNEVAFLTFSVRGQSGAEGLDLRVADRNLERKEDSALVGDVQDFLPEGRISQVWQQAWVPLSRLPEKIDRRHLAGLIFQARGHGQIFIKDLAFVTSKDMVVPGSRRLANASRLVRKALWLWETDRILNSVEEKSSLVTFCQRQGITDLFVQIPYEAEQDGGQWRIDWQPEKFPSLLRALHHAGVRVDALDGDPRYVLKDFHGRVLALISAVVSYNRGVPPEERFAGVRFDNEPYLLPQFPGIHKTDILHQYLVLLQKARPVANQANLSFGVDIPFWFDSHNKFFEPTAKLNGHVMTKHILDHVDNVAIMDYRTQAYGADSVIAHAQSELEYAAQRGTDVFVALETVSLPDETIFEFGSRGRQDSCVILKQVGGRRVQIHWMSVCPGPDPSKIAESKGEIRLWQTNRTEVPADKQTFSQRSAAELTKVMMQVADEFSHFPSFAGFALHSYESYRPMVRASPGG